MEGRIIMISKKFIVGCAIAALSFVLPASTIAATHQQGSKQTAETRVGSRNTAAFPSAVKRPEAAVNASYISSNTGGANLRTCASQSCSNNPYVGYLSNGQHLQMLCWATGASATGNYTSNRWFLVGLPYSNHFGWVHSSLVANQISVGQCSNTTSWG